MVFAFTKQEQKRFLDIIGSTFKICRKLNVEGHEGPKLKIYSEKIGRHIFPPTNT